MKNCILNTIVNEINAGNLVNVIDVKDNYADIEIKDSEGEVLSLNITLSAEIKMGKIITNIIVREMVVNLVMMDVDDPSQDKMDALGIIFKEAYEKFTQE